MPPCSATGEKALAANADIAALLAPGAALLIAVGGVISVKTC